MGCAGVGQGGHGCESAGVVMVGQQSLHLQHYDGIRWMTMHSEEVGMQVIMPMSRAGHAGSLVQEWQPVVADLGKPVCIRLGSGIDLMK